MGEFNFFDHTADIAVEVSAETFEDLFSISAAAWLHAVLEKPNVRSSKIRTITITAGTVEELLVNFLSEINYLLLSKKWIFASVKKIRIRFEEKLFHLSADIAGENLNFDKHALKEEIKAVTYHQMVIEKKKNKYSTKIVFDI